ncbi:uncharacterized protein BYT42DRAFT_569982 [Radiomyces spectabilis]|uniref:uncharacterized protein n=1 Tax=Radiomyces spectabilis TaxID=64574 RepID=UPI00221F0CD5|nr:uncharacterized protein BYT42DRAFT_569982 [Radiomyces spectabilis]KAI8379773.1 hypothetical protein BYT42DRAFT_569982 [Radiomyces spectabilis]
MIPANISFLSFFLLTYYASTHPPIECGLTRVRFHFDSSFSTDRMVESQLPCSNAGSLTPLFPSTSLSTMLFAQFIRAC